MADRWEEEAKRVWSAINEDQNAELAPVAVALTHIAESLRRAESSGREAERAELHPLLFTVQGHLIAWSTVEGVPPLPSALVAALRQIEALRARPGGTNGR